MQWLMEMPTVGGKVIPAHAMLPDRADDLIGAKLKLFNAQPSWTRKKRRLREELDALCERLGYIGFWGDYRNYALHRVGQSFQYDVPLKKRGWLAPLSGKRVRIICIYSGPYRRWLRAGPVKNVEI
jgi:hypothetical protein